MTSVSFSVVGTPVSQGSKKAFRRGAKIVLVETAAGLSAWRQDVAAMASRALDGKPWDPTAPMRVTIAMRFTRPASHFTASLTLRKGAPSDKTSKPDIDKLLRAVLDACTGVVWRDDAQVYHVDVRKEWTVGAPGCDVVAVAGEERGT